MAQAPLRCPLCGEIVRWIKVDQGRKGFSAGKAAAGALLAGPIGLAAGALGKKKVTYACGKCGFKQDYDA